jgi:hypothetical protein
MNSNGNMAGCLRDVTLTGEIHFNDGYHTFHFVLFNESSSSLVFANDFLDPRNIDNYFFAVTNSVIRESIPWARPLTEYSHGRVEVPSGGRFEYDFTLETYFFDFREYLRQTDITVFWSIRLQALDNPKVIIINGFAIVPERQ